MKCPGFEMLIEYLDGRLKGHESEDVQSHLASACSRCDEERAWYELVKQVAASDDSIEPPQWVLKRAFRIFESQTAQKGLAARAGRLIASLVFDSFARPAMAGARSAEAIGRQLLYRAEDFGIDMQIESAEQARAEITGQILREGEMTFDSVKRLPLTLLRDGRAVSSTFTNDRGEFIIASVDSGKYDLQIEADELSITIVGLPIS